VRAKLRWKIQRNVKMSHGKHRLVVTRLATSNTPAPHEGPVRQESTCTAALTCALAGCAGSSGQTRRCRRRRPTGSTNTHRSLASSTTQATARMWASPVRKPSSPFPCREGESGPGGLTREEETPLPSNSPHDHMILREDLVGSHGRRKRPCLQTAHMTI
jgi:hypothetical protein